jgi:hypothetical protein
MLKRWQQLNHYFRTRFILQPNFIRLLGLLVLLWALHRWNTQYEGSAVNRLFQQLITLSFYTLLIVPVVTLLLTVVSWLWNWNRLRHLEPGQSFRLMARDRDTTVLKMPQLVAPLLGRLQVLLQTNKQLWISKRNEQHRKPSKSTWALFEQQELFSGNYETYEIIVRHVDMLGLFAIPVGIPWVTEWIVPPMGGLPQSDLPEPRVTEQMLQKIKHWKKIEGEWLHYKKFDWGDDVRRVVWPVFARSRELMVRQPELQEPYASHVYIYASFYQQYLDGLAPEFAAMMADHYRRSIWSLLEAMETSDVQFRLAPDQSAGIAHVTGHQVRESIARLEWQLQHNLQEYVKPRKASVLIVHSGTDADALQQLISQNKTLPHLVFIPLSGILKRPLRLRDWLSWIWLPPPDHRDAIRKRWWLSPVRQQMLHNEKRLQQIIADAQRSGKIH